MIIEVSSEIEKTARVLQLEGMFDIPSSERAKVVWEVNLPLAEKPWNIGLIVGPSGCGKSTIAKKMFPEQVDRALAWHRKKSVIDGFPSTMNIAEIVELLSSVGFSSPPAWLRPFHVLSNGEQFRGNNG